MKYNEKVKLLDFIIERITDTEYITIDPILKNNPFKDKYEEYVIRDNIISFAEKKDVFIENGVGVYGLTLNGEELKKFGKGFEKYEKKMNSKNSTIWYNQPWLGFLGTFIFGLLNLYQVFYNNDLKNQVYSLEKSRDSLINEVSFLKENIVPLKSDNYHLKEKLSLYKDSLFVLKSNNLKEK